MSKLKKPPEPATWISVRVTLADLRIYKRSGIMPSRAINALARAMEAHETQPALPLEAESGGRNHQGER